MPPVARTPPVTRSHAVGQRRPASVDATPRAPANPPQHLVTPLPAPGPSRPPRVEPEEEAIDDDEEDTEGDNHPPEDDLPGELPSLEDAFRLLSQVVLQRTGPSTSTSAPPFQTPEMKKPDSFDGRSHYQLQNYLQQCKLIFINDPQTFSEDSRKTIYASSYLSGKAFEWVQPYLASMTTDPDFLLNSWEKFEEKLNTLFGDPNELRNIENLIDTLVMRESEPASSYISSF